MNKSAVWMSAMCFVMSDVLMNENLYGGEVGDWEKISSEIFQMSANASDGSAWSTPQKA